MSHFYSLPIDRVQQDTRDAIIISLHLPDELRSVFAYQQGQHLTLRAMIDGEDVRRSYSLCSAVQDEQLQIAIKKVSGGIFSGWAHANLKAGMALDVMPPMGHFQVPLQPEQSRHYLAFAAGSGITPIYSIIKTSLLTEPQSRVTLVYGNRASSTVMLREALADLKDRFLDRLSIVHVMSREKQEIDLFNGRIDADKCRSLAKHWIRVDDVDVGFICGPESMTRQLSETLQALGMVKDQIKTELFSASTADAAAAAARRQVRASKASAVGTQCEVSFIIDGHHHQITMERDSQSLLDAGLSHGIDIRYACKGGICATCRCKVVEGRVDMDANHALEDYEIARGFVLSCQAFAASERLVLDFDQDS
jgi:ring-1,2-phenylacetyl-CoA epoxidase subunit PaaE